MAGQEDEYIQVGDDVSFFNQEFVKGFMACPLTTKAYATALILPSSAMSTKGDEVAGAAADGGSTDAMIGDFQAGVFQIVAQEKFKRVKKLEKMYPPPLSLHGIPPLILSVVHTAKLVRWLLCRSPSCLASTINSPTSHLIVPRCPLPSYATNPNTSFPPHVQGGEEEE
jgi:hypothetical protein